MNILALDLGVRTGFAYGAAGSMPSSATVILKKPSEHRAVALGNLIAWLDTQLRTDRPDVVVREAPLALQAFKHLGNAAFTVVLTHGLHGIVEGMCMRFGIRCEEFADATIRKHFIGRANCGDRAATKAAVVQRCRLLGYMPSDACDDNRADALALFDYAAAHFGGRMARELHLFGESATDTPSSPDQKPRDEQPRPVPSQIERDESNPGWAGDLDPEFPSYLRRGPDNRSPFLPPPGAPPSTGPP